MNFQYAEVPWYPDPPALDLWRRHGVLCADQPFQSFQWGFKRLGVASHSLVLRRINSKSPSPNILTR